MALRAYIFLQEFFDTGHAFFIPHLGKRIFHGVDGVVVGEVQFPSLIGAFCLVEDMFFDSRPVIDDILLLCCKLAKRNIGTHAHGTAYISHERPHEAVPGSNGALVDAE